MSVVFVYGGSGQFKGGEIEWSSPQVGSTHKFMLFLLQDLDEPMQDAAVAQIRRLGFDQLEMWEGRKIVVESLNDPQMTAFRKHYEVALSEGFSLVWYP